MTKDETISKSAGEIGLFTSPFKLKTLFLEENPLVETSKGKKSVAEYLLTNGISSLRSVDGVSLNTGGDGAAGAAGAVGAPAIKMNKVLHRKEREEEDGDMDAYREKGLDNQEKEFLAALKGERDNSVVS